MTYINALRELETLSDEKLISMYESEMVYLTDKRDIFLTVYTARLDRERVEYINDDSDLDGNYDSGTTLSLNDIKYLHEQKAMVEIDESKIIFSDDEYTLLSREISAMSQAITTQAKNYMSSSSAIFLVSMLGSFGVEKKINLKYGTNPVFDSPNSDTHIHIQNLIGFTGLCNVCLNDMNLADSMRKPQVEGGWEGWFCSENCMSRYIIDSGESEVDLVIYLNMLRVISS